MAMVITSSESQRRSQPGTYIYRKDGDDIQRVTLDDTLHQWQKRLRSFTNEGLTNYNRMSGEGS